MSLCVPLIDSDVPLPEKAKGGRRRGDWHRRTIFKYPFHQMEVGDSFFVPDRSLRGCLQVCVHKQNRSTGAHFTIRVWRQDGVDGLRVWMTGARNAHRPEASPTQPHRACGS